MFAVCHAGNMNLRTTDLRKLNSATEYPSIPTYHVLGDKGRLREEVQVSFANEEVLVTEKLDGTNTRIVVLDDRSYVIGSREELLHARGDIVFNPAMGIVAAVRAIAVADAFAGSGRVVDVVSVMVDELVERLSLTAEEIAHRRDGGDQKFIDERELAEHAAIAGVEITPRIDAAALPTDLHGTHAWLKSVLPGETLAPLDADRKGRPEGVVVRTRDRRAIAKLRFDDYERTLR
jgi:hypothetical protein